MRLRDLIFAVTLAIALGLTLAAAKTVAEAAKVCDKVVAIYGTEGET